MPFIPVFPEILKIADFRWKNADVSRTQRCVTWFMYFLDLLQVRYNCAKFHQCTICVTDFRERGPFAPPSPQFVSTPKRSILNRININSLNLNRVNIYRAKFVDLSNFSNRLFSLLLRGRKRKIPDSENEASFFTQVL